MKRIVQLGNVILLKMFMMMLLVGHANAQTPEPTATPGGISLPLSSGSTVIVTYSWTFGEMAITSLLVLLIVFFAARWLYDLILQLWSLRGDNDRS